MYPLEDTMLKAIVDAHERWGQPFEEAEWWMFVEPLRPHLRRIEEAGGDAVYVLFVLSNFRWRVMSWGGQADLDQCRDLRDTIDRIVLNKGVVWRKLGQDLRKLGAQVDSLLGESVLFCDEGPFGEFTRGDGVRSRSVYRVLLALSDHLRKAIPPRRINREEALAEVVEAAAIRSCDDPAGSGKSESFNALDWLHKRLQRAPRRLLEPVRGWVVAYLPQDMVIAYHQFHAAAGVDCGRACQVEADWVCA